MFNLFVIVGVGDQPLSRTGKDGNMQIRDIAAVVTGGASGLGLATARALCAGGARVAIFDLNEKLGTDAARLVDGIFCKTDVTDDASVDSAFAKARETHGQERILVNCAGTTNAFKTVARDRKAGGVKEFPMEAFNLIIQVNLIGTFRCMVKSASGMLSLDPLRDGERGVMINTASVAAEEGQAGQAAYAASKSGIVGLTVPVARDLASEGIRVNAILPGIFDTPLMQAASDPLKAALVASVLFPKRFGSPEEFGSLALEMIRNSYFNGAHVRLDGSIRMTQR
jgi:NAD(P)-dependent dehydrogenase (short-subunit alcohol dehydrogenase family)